MRRRPAETEVRAPYGGDTVLRLASGGPQVNEMYHWLLTASWARFAAALIGSYLALNAAFGLAYMACGDGIENARPGSFADAFFFSVQTMATIGYGRMAPVSMLANALVTAEAGIGLFGVAVAAAVMFARFTRPTAGVRFSRNMVVGRFDGKKTLSFRLANERTDQIHEARVHVVMVRDETTAEGQQYRRLHDLPLMRSFTPVFGLSWTVIHVIDEASPLRGATAEDLARCQASFTVLFSGHHDAFQQDVHARHSYAAADIAWGHRFADLLFTLPDGRRAMDDRRFDDLVPETGETAQAE